VLPTGTRLYGAAVRWSPTVGVWTRWDTLSAAAAAAAAGLAADADLLDIGWAKTAGLIVAAGLAASLLAVRVGRAQVEGRRERAEASRRLRIPVTAVEKVDPVAIGVDRAAQAVRAGGERPV
jgi:hypothetical protein